MQFRVDSECTSMLFSQLAQINERGIEARHIHAYRHLYFYGLLPNRPTSYCMFNSIATLQMMQMMQMMKMLQLIKNCICSEFILTPCQKLYLLLSKYYSFIRGWLPSFKLSNKYVAYMPNNCW